MSERYRKSAHSESGNCVEVGEDWRKSSRSNPNGACIEVASGVAVRDTQLGADSPVLKFTPQAWREFTAQVRTA